MPDEEGNVRAEGEVRGQFHLRGHDRHLGVFPIGVPALRERREDIPLLVWRFIQSRQRSLGRQITRIADAAMDALVGYDWPGNVRELQNVVDRALILSPGPASRACWSAAPGSSRGAGRPPIASASARARCATACAS